MPDKEVEQEPSCPERDVRIMEVTSYDDLQELKEEIMAMDYVDTPTCVCAYRVYNEVYGTYSVRVALAYEQRDRAITLPSELREYVCESQFALGNPMTIDNMMMVDVIPNTRIERG